MDFDAHKAIYIQIANHICDKILDGQFKNGNKIPSMRYIATTFKVNPNTVQRSYELLQKQAIIYNKRGIGYFVTQNATEIIMKMRREDFYKNELPSLFKQVNLLNIKMEDINSRYKKFMEETKNEKVHK